MRNDPYNLTGFFIVFGMLAVTGVLSWLLHALSEHVETRVPAYRRPLEAMYASFHRFLQAVRAAAERGI